MGGGEKSENVWKKSVLVLGAGEGMIERSGYEGVVCLWFKAVYDAHSHTWQP